MLTYVSALALGGLAVGCALVVTSMVTTSWITLADESHIGLFSHCSHSSCAFINFTQEEAITGRNLQSEFKAVRGLVISGLIVSICGSMMALGFVLDAVRSKQVKSMTLLWSSMVLNPLGGMSIILGAAVFAGTIYEDLSESSSSSSKTFLGYSFGLCIGGGVSVVMSCVLVFLAGPRKATRFYETPCLNPTPHTMTCLQHPPPFFSSDQFLITEFRPPPRYEEKCHPPSYEEALMLPPPYEETEKKGQSSSLCPSN